MGSPNETASSKASILQRLVRPLEMLAALAEQTDVRITLCHTGRVQLYDFGESESDFEADALTPVEAAEKLAAALADRPEGWSWTNRELSEPDVG